MSFLRTLTDQDFLTNDKWADPWSTVLSNSPELLAGVKVYPNPVADVVIVEFENPGNETYNVSIFDIHGKAIESFKTSSNVLEVPRGNAPAGIYELIATNGQQQKTFKLVYR